MLCEKVERKDVEIGERTGKAEEHKGSERERSTLGEGLGKGGAAWFASNMCAARSGEQKVKKI